MASFSNLEFACQQQPGSGKKFVPQSPELAGGAGFTFEGAVAALYLTQLLGRGTPLVLMIVQCAALLFSSVTSANPSTM
jgi:hypothetical protein